MCHDFFAESGIDFIPHFGQKDFVLWGMGDFVDITSIHFITNGIIP